MSTESKWIDVIINLCRNWFVVLITAVLFALGSFFYTSYCVTELFYSRGSLYVDSASKKTSEDVIYQEIITSKELIYTYIEVLQSDHFMDLVAKESGLDYSGKQVKQMVNMSSLNETELMEISVLTPSPEVSQKLIQTILDNAGNEMNRVIKGGSVHVVDNASYNSNSSYPNYGRNILLAFFVGAILAIAVLYYTDVFDTRIKTEFDCKNFNLPILGEVPGVEIKINNN